MRVLVTGAFGNIGASTVAALLADGHTVRAFGRPSRRARGVARRFRDEGRAEIAWGDVRSAADVRRAVADQDAIVHLAAVLPPESEADPARAEAVNVGGTRVVLQAAWAQPVAPRLLFASSFDVFGRTQHLPPPRRLSDPVAATDAYTAHKLTGEEMVRASGLASAIFRFCDVPPLAARSPHPIMFRIPLETRFEVLHTHDAGLAIARALGQPETWGRIWLVGGGPTCQVRYRDYLGAMLNSLGIGMLPDAAFATAPAYCTDWLDSADSQRAFQYQRHSFQQVIADVTAALGWQRYVAPLVRPIARRVILGMSPEWKAARRGAVVMSGPA